MTSFTDRFGGITIYPSDLGYQAYSITTSTALTWPELGDTSSNLAANFIRASTTVTGASFIIPDARDVSVGLARRIKNIGSITLPILSTSGSTIANVGAGQDYLLTLIDNTTSGGLWDTEQLGVGTSSADAQFLAGNGLATSGGTLVINWPVVSTGSNGYQMDVTSRATLLTWTGGTGTIGYTVGAAFAGNGFINAIKNKGSGILTVSGGAFFASTIDGQASIDLNPGDSAFIIKNSQTDFQTLGLNTGASIGVLTLEINNAGTTTLTSTQVSGNRIFILTGQAAGNRGPETIVFPQSPGEFTIVNQMLSDTGIGAYGMGFIKVKTSAASGAFVYIPMGSTRSVVSDGTNIYFVDDISTERPARNILYWCDFAKNPWQRGTTFTSSSVIQYAADRVSWINTSGSGWNLSRITSANTGTQYDLQLSRVLGSPPASGAAIYLGFDLELAEAIQLRGRNVSLAMEFSYGSGIGVVTADLYSTGGSNVKILSSLSGATGAPTGWTFEAEINSVLGQSTSGAASGYYTFVSTPYTTDLSSGTATGLNQISVLVQTAAAGTGVANQYINISRIALVDGSFSGFDKEEPGEILRKCQRFAYQYTASAIGNTLGLGQAVSTNGALIPLQFPVTMRQAPSLTVTASNFQLTTSTGAAASCTSLAINTSGSTSYGANLLVGTTTALLAAGNGTLLQATTTTASLLFSADL